MVKTYIVFIHFYPAMRILLVVSLFVISIYIEKIIKTIIYNLLVNNTLCEDIFYNYKIYFLYYKIVVFILQNGNII